MLTSSVCLMITSTATRKVIWIQHHHTHTRLIFLAGPGPNDDWMIFFWFGFLWHSIDRSTFSTTHFTLLPQTQLDLSDRNHTVLSSIEFEDQYRFACFAGRSAVACH